MARRVPHILVLSLGNPAPYLNTPHSAGHAALEALRRDLRLPPFAKSRRLGGKPALTTATAATGTGTDGQRYTLVQSPTLMNVSGPWVARVWRDALGEAAPTDGQPGLVLVHDDLEEPLGALRLRPWARSHRGHNGLKSVNASLRPADFPGARWAKLSVGVGRPDARDPTSVADYVLRPMDAAQRAALEQGLGANLAAMLRQVAAQWEEQAAREEAGGEVGQDAASAARKPPKKPRTRPSARQP